MDVPLLVAVSTFLAILLASSAAFLYMNSREALQAWRRRAEGSPLANEPANGGAVDHMRAQFQALLEWFAKLNQPANVEEARATRRRLITAGYRSAKAPVVFAGVKLFLAVLMTVLIWLVPVKLLAFHQPHLAKQSTPLQCSQAWGEAPVRTQERFRSSILHSAIDDRAPCERLP